MNELIAIVLGSEAVTVIITAIITAISNRKSKSKTIESEQRPSRVNCKRSIKSW